MSAYPVVPWAQLITGQPPSGGADFGTDTVPDTTIGCPAESSET
ncbi:hypothetical protein [Mycobacterium sp. 236(2023)]|nr:hypothetical protein [Mycobacterium sp. 236(2023)]MDG4665941.1 hypothetical protein [Mycobacterium sp. 236(2023)]